MMMLILFHLKHPLKVVMEPSGSAETDPNNEEKMFYVKKKKYSDQKGRKELSRKCIEYQNSSSRQQPLRVDNWNQEEVEDVVNV